VKWSKLDPNYRDWTIKGNEHGEARSGKMDWRKLAEMHMQIDGTGMAPEAEAHLRTMAWWGRMSVTDAEEFRKKTDFFGAGTAGDGKEGNWRWIASIPHNVMSALLQVNPDLLKDMKEFKKWLRTEGVQYQVPGSQD